MVRRFMSGNDFDAVLSLPDQRNISSLTLLVRVYLQQFNPDHGAREGTFNDPNGHNRGTFRIQQWNPAEWENFKVGYKREVETFLNWPRMGLWLQPTSIWWCADSKRELQEFLNPNPLSPALRRERAMRSVAYDRADAGAGSRELHRPSAKGWRPRIQPIHSPSLEQFRRRRSHFKPQPASLAAADRE